MPRGYTSVITFGASGIPQCIIDAVQLPRLSHGPPCREREIGVAALLLENGKLIVHATEIGASLAPGIGESEVSMNEAPGRTSAWPCGERTVSSISLDCLAKLLTKGRFRVIAMMEVKLDFSPSSGAELRQTGELPFIVFIPWIEEAVCG
jgi:hypothetical protein